MSAQPLAELLGLTEGGVWLLAAAAVSMAAAAVARGLARYRRGDAESLRAWRSVGTWWTLFALFLVVLASGSLGVLVAMGLLSLLLLTETLRLVRGPAPVAPLALVGLSIYGWAWLDWRTVFSWVLPLAAVLVVVGEAVRRAGGSRQVDSRGFGWHHAMLIAVIGPAYAFGVAALPPPGQMPESDMGWFVLLMVLTELNDMAQAWWGRTIGSRPLAPVLSPRKTWEGLLGGLATTSAAALVLGPILTSWGRAQPVGLELPVPTWAWSLGLGLAIGLAGISGDLAASALKRAAGVKDSGTRLPGHGGVLDRFDSLAATAPVFFFLSHLLWFAEP